MRILLYCNLGLLAGYFLFMGFSQCNESPVDITVEVMIVCDKKFSDYYGQDREKILDYWTVYMSSVDDKFRTLRKMNVTFKVIEVLIIKESLEQPFIEKARNVNQTVVISDTLSKFSRWIYSHWEKMNFDLAILITGEEVIVNVRGFWDWVNSFGVCDARKHPKVGTHQGVMVLDFKYALGNHCGFLEYGLVQLLSRPIAFYEPCNDEPYQNTYGDCRIPFFYFSECIDEQIRQDVYRDTKTCLHIDGENDSDVLKNRTKIVYPPSLTDQCVMITNNVNAKSAETGNDCVSVNCFLENNRSLSLMRSIHPVDGSNCGNDKSCFRGRCLPNGYVLQNVGSAKCVFAEDGFYSAVLLTGSCVENPTRTQEFMVLDGNSTGKLLATPYYSPAAGNYFDKCLSWNETNNVLQFLWCSTNETETLGWDLIDIGSNDEFLLFHRYSNSCLMIQENLKVNASKNCNVTDDWMKWKLQSKLGIPWMISSKNDDAVTTCHINNFMLTFGFLGILCTALAVVIVLWLVGEKIWKQKVSQNSTSRMGFLNPCTTLHNHENGMEMTGNGIEDKENNI